MEPRLILTTEPNLAALNWRPLSCNSSQQSDRLRHFESCKIYDMSPLPPRDQSIRTFREGIALAQKAIRLNHFLVFCGE